MDIGKLVDRLPGWIKTPLVGAINRFDPLRLWLSRRIINKAAYAAPVRPRPLSMAADYTSWPGLTDRRFSGRHLPPADGATAPTLPDLDRVADLFKRETFQPATDTSILFPLFAQWFVDGFLRTKWEPEGERQFRENESNHDIDLNQIYGMSDVQTTMLRDDDKSGRLRSQLINGESWPAPLFEKRDGRMVLSDRYRRIPERYKSPPDKQIPGHDADSFEPAVPGLYTPDNFQRVFGTWTDEQKRHAFAVGLEHGNSTLGHAAMNTLFLREHNRTADILKKANPDWPADRLFQTARNVTLTVLLNIVIGDYIVHIAPAPIRLEARPGMAEKERWYRTNWIPVEFALLYRWHPLIPEELTIGAERLPAERFRRANEWLVSKGLGPVLRAASVQHAGRIGLANTADFLLVPRDQHGPDVARLSLEMGRACRLQSFNAYRRHYGLEPVTSFEALTGEAEMAGRLKALYQDIDRLEWFVGLFAEGFGKSHMMGELMTTMVANDAFTQALTNPLLAEAVHNEATFSKAGYAIVRETRTLAQVIARNTGIDDPSQFGFTLR